MRKYKSGSKWAFCRWTETPSGYITRLHLIQTPFGAIMLHWINHPDAEPHLHDHPVTFLSIILKGGYLELRQDMRKSAFAQFKDRRWFNFIHASYSDRHRICAVMPGTLTLCFMGPKRREWGFHTEVGWVYWKDYNTLTYHT